MSTATETQKSTGTWLAPYLTVDHAEQVADFIKHVFNAEEQVRAQAPGGSLHVTLKIGDATVMVGGGERYPGPFFPTAIHIYVPDCDATHRRAVQSGATELHAPMDQPYGERSSAVRDVGGTEWYIATAKGGDYKPKGVPDAMLYLHPAGADRLLAFVKQAFGAEEIEVYRDEQSKAPNPPIVHAKVRLGESILEMGEAHGEWQNLPSTVFLHVADCEAAYERSVVAGGQSIQEPRNEPYGRVGAVQDEFGNRWYVVADLPSQR